MIVFFAAVLMTATLTVAALVAAHDERRRERFLALRRVRGRFAE